MGAARCSRVADLGTGSRLALFGRRDSSASAAETSPKRGEGVIVFCSRIMGTPLDTGEGLGAVFSKRAPLAAGGAAARSSASLGTTGAAASVGAVLPWGRLTRI